MNKRLLLLCTTLLPVFLSAEATEDTDAACCCTPPTMEITWNANALTAAKFEEDGFTDQELRYAEAMVQANITHQFNDCDGLTWGVGGRYTDLKWVENPHFSERNFYDIFLASSLFTQRWDCWYWRAGALFAFDTDHILDGAYTKHQGLIWGRYNYSDCLGLHIGAMWGLGLNDDYVYPVLGIDYSPSCDWKINLVLPVNVSAVYSLNDCLDIDIALRRLKARHRVDEDQTLSRGIFEYRSYGVELGATLHIGPYLSTRLHAGSTGGGNLKVMDSQGSDVASYAVDGAAYVGGNLALHF
ncbi:MAG: hypothetical protein KDK78_03885 [Chlamydiia bacterium]|nr:hypothetical protein [Chlamydiia bacterium]